MQVRPTAGGNAQPVAIAAEFLEKTAVFHFEIAGRRLLAITSRRGANRVYALGRHPVAFQAIAAAGTLTDTQGRVWRQAEEALVLKDGSISLPRVVAHRAFWFGWYAQYPDTILLGQSR